MPPRLTVEQRTIRDLCSLRSAVSFDQDHAPDPVFADQCAVKLLRIDGWIERLERGEPLPAEWVARWQ